MLCCVGLGVGGWWVATAVALSDVANSGRAVPMPPVLAGPLMSLASPFAPLGVSPTAARVAADRASRTAFRGLRRGAVISLARRDFHVQVPAWTPPGSEAGVHLERYVGDYAVAERLEGGGHALVTSTIPLRVNDGSGAAPMSLALRDDGEAFVPVNPAVPVAISTRADGAVSFPGGISVTPVGVVGGEAPMVVGDRVVFANEQPTTDLMAEPRPSGAEIAWQLRSQESPGEEQLAFHLPSGGALRQSVSEPGAVEAVVGGTVELRVRPAFAQSADGESVPVSYSVSGDVLTTHVDLSSDVAFPVLVDPELEVGLLAGNYGTENGAGVWSGWQHANSASNGCASSEYCASESAGLIQTKLASPGREKAWGEWYIYAPSPQGKSGSAGITRVDLTGLSHRANEQSALYGEIGKTNGSDPVYSWNGAEGASGNSPLLEVHTRTNAGLAFCAQAGGGHDGGYPPLCDEELDQGEYFVFGDEQYVSKATEANYVQAEGVTITYREPANPNKVVLDHPGYTEGQWLKSGPTNWTMEAEDEGLGIAETQIRIPLSNETPFASKSYACGGEKGSANGFTGCPTGIVSEPINLSEVGAGMHEIAGVAKTPAQRKASAAVLLNIDKTPPVIGSFGGTLGQAANGEVGDGSYTLGYGAEDGSHTQPQSGVRTLEVEVDGKVVEKISTSCREPLGVPAEGCFDLSSVWTMDAQRFGVGTHVITVVARDWAGNESSKSFSVTVNEAAYAPLGAGAVNLQTGDYKVSQSDVAISGGEATLSVARTYDSRKLTQGSSGPLGPQWLLSLPDSGAGWQSLSELANGAIALYSSTGQEVTFAATKEGTYVSPSGYQTDTLTKYSSSPVEYQIIDAQGGYMRFARPSGSEAFLPDKSGEAIGAGTNGLNKVSYTFATEEGITRPTEMLGPEPSEGACTAKLVQGCRALTFQYATSTNSETGEYKGRLSKVLFTAWEPVKGEMSAPIAVAQYEYSSQGWLDAEWDPRISPVLKISYGYDSEGHLTAITPPGEETSVMIYGTLSGEGDTGRLLKVTQAPASAPVWTKGTPANTTAPVVSGSPVPGVRLAVSQGKWSGSPVGYSYAWKECNASGGECTPILGADNANYTPGAREVGHTMIAVVTATNGGGSVSKETAATSVVRSAAITEYALPASSSPWAVTLGPDKNMWVTDAGTGKIEKLTSTGSRTEYSSDNDEPQGITTGPDGNLWFVEAKAAHAGRVTTSGTLTEFNVAGHDERGFGIVTGPEKDLWITEQTSGYIAKLNTNGEVLSEYKLPAGSRPAGITVGPNNNVWFVDEGTGKVGQIVSGQVAEYKLQAGLTLPYDITSGPDGNLWVTEIGSGNVNTSKIVKITTSGTISAEYTVPGEGEAQEIISGPEKDLWFTTGRGESIDRITTGGTLSEYAVPYGSDPHGIAEDSEGNVWFTDLQSNKVSKLNPAPIEKTEGEQVAPGPGTTVEYRVPASGTGAPYALGAKEVEAWGQKNDVPREATAIFAPDEPQNWPASTYKRASVYYMDSDNRVVNTASPSGAISTTEYDVYNNVVRTLTPDNRVRALEAGSKSVEQAGLLDTQNDYSKGGTELLSSLGPQHALKLPSGEVVNSRKYTAYEYDQGEPGNGPYYLVTSTSEGSLISGQNVEDKRTVTRSYSGQSGLGWKLKEPTSTTTSTGMQNLTSTTVYEASTGAVKEAIAPAGKSGSKISRSYAQFATHGTESGEVNGATADTIDSSGDVWVADTSNNRIDEFSSSGTFLKAVGWGVAEGKEKLEVCTSECKAGLAGSGKGQLSAPQGIAFDPANEHLYVSDTGNDRVQDFTTAGKLGTNGFGAKGSSELQFNEPAGIAAEPGGNLWIADKGNHRLQEATNKGKYVAIAGAGKGEYTDVTVCAGKLYATDYAGDRIDEVGTEGPETILKAFGYQSGENGRFTQVSHIACDPKTNQLYITDQSANNVKLFTTAGGYVETFGSTGTGTGGQFEKPLGVSFSAGGTAYIVDSGNSRVQEITVSNAAAHDTQTTYYTAGANSEYENCGKHPEWAGLPCQGQPAGQPETSGIPNLPVTTYTYNIWDEPLTTTDTVGSTERTTTIAYDADGRTTATAITSNSSSDVSLPEVKIAYNEHTGALKEQTSSSKHIKIEQNTLGQITTYTDAEGGVTKYAYEPEKDFRLAEVSENTGGPAAGTDSYTYNSTTGELESVKDSGVGTFTATRDIEGNITTERLPNGLDANYTYNQVGEPTSLEYKKVTDCSNNCTWYSDTVTPSAHGQWRTQSTSIAGGAPSTLNYNYDGTGRLTEVQETPAGQGCTTRLYVYDEDGNRTSQTTRAPGSEGKCATTGGTTTTHTYDTADRLNESGVSYDPFGNTTELPAADAGGTPLANTYYVNDTLASQEQNGAEINYKLDPAGRIRETVSSGTVTGTVISHYSGPTSSPAWTINKETEAWTRNVTNVSGGLAAIQSSSEGAILQLANLHGDIIATASTSESESKLTLANETTEYGVPRTTVTSKHSWLGTAGVSTELPTGVINMGARTYIPELGRFEQTDPQPGGSTNAYAYTFDDPVNQSDPSGEWTYNYDAQETGEAAPGAPRSGLEPGAIIPPPADLQAEAELAAHPPWTAATVYTVTFEAGAAFAAMVPGPRGYFSYEWKVNTFTAISLARAFDLLAAGDNPGTLSAIKGLPSILYQAIVRVAKAHYLGEFSEMSQDLRLAASEAVGPITLIASGYLYGSWNLNVSFERIPVEELDE
jgi:RHS repeat-associated protein